MARTVAVNLSVTGVSSVVAGFTEVAAASKGTAGQLEKHAASAKKLGSSMTLMGAVAAAGVGLMVKAAVDWQNEWTKVAVDAQGTTAQIDALQGSLRNMAKDMPVSAAKIAEVAGAVAELGVAAPNIAEFSRVMIDLSETTNLTATDAAVSISKFMNVMGTSVTDVGRLGATIMELADTSAATASEIVDMSLKIAGVANLIGFTEAQTLSLSSALASMGSSMAMPVAQGLQKMDAAVRAGGDGLDALAATSGMTSAEFSQAWGTDAAGATAKFVTGLGKIMSSGGSVDDVLARLKISAGKQADGWRRLAADSDLLSNSLKTGENAWSANTALVAEATKQYSTAESRITIAWNRINDAAITAGGKLLPMIAGLADGAGKMGDAFGSLPGPVLSLVSSLGIGVAVFGLAGGGLLKLAVSAAEARTAFAAMSVAYPAASAAMVTVGKAAGVAALALVAFAAGAAAMKATGIENTFGTLDDAATTMAKLSGKTDLAASGIDAFFKNTTWTQSLGASGITDGVNSLSTAFDRLNHPLPVQQMDDFTESVMAFTGTQSAVSKINDQFKKLDQGLAAMGAGGGADQAAAAFQKVAAAAKDASPEQLTKLFPEYAHQVYAAGQAVGYTFDGSKELAAAMQGILPAGMTATQKATIKMKGTVDEAKFSMDDLVKSMFEVGSAALKTSGSAIGVAAAIDDATKAAKDNGKNLDINTEKGRANRTALDQIASSAEAYISQLTATNAETSKVVGATQQARDSFVATAVKMGMSAAAANALADQYGLIPGDVKTNVTAPGASQARGSVEDLRASIVNLPPGWQTYINTTLQTKGVEAAYAVKKDLESHPIIIPVQIVVPKGVKIGTGSIAITAADGALFKAYAQGGFENHVAQIAPAGAWRVWAEPETGGESYIPLAQEKWPRSREIWWETGKHLGMVAHADGALYSGGKSAAPNVNVGGANVDVYVKAAPDGSYIRAIAEDVVHREANEVRWR
jgi:TP901 family phage tail tape measure protein